jgi:hypothetical protein
MVGDAIATPNSIDAMSLRNLQEQLLRDLKRSWAKTALLGVLLVVGIVLWVPPIFRSTTGGSGRSPVALPVNSTGSAAKTVSQGKAEPANGRVQVTEVFSWTSADEWLRFDPAARPAEMSLVRKNPFKFDRDQFAPPILFEAEPPPVSEGTETGVLASSNATPDIKGAVLTTTIVGLNRRAALINDRLYNEGSEFKLDGQTFAVERILPDRVRLSQEGVVYYLTIPSRYEINP